MIEHKSFFWVKCLWRKSEQWRIICSCLRDGWPHTAYKN